MTKKIQKFVVVMICEGIGEYFVSNLKWIKVKESAWRSEFSFNDNATMFFDDEKQAREAAHEASLQRTWDKFEVRPVKIG